MSNNKITLGVSKSAPEMKNRAISLIVALSGEDPMVLAHKTEDELLQYLSYLLKMEKGKLEELLVEHDQAKEEDLVSLMKHWKAVAKGKMKGKKKEFGSLENEVYKYLKILFAQRGDQARFAVENQTGALTSDVNNSAVNPQKRNNSVNVVNSESKALFEKISKFLQSVNKSGPGMN